MNKRISFWLVWSLMVVVVLPLLVGGLSLNLDTRNRAQSSSGVSGYAQPSQVAGGGQVAFTFTSNDGLTYVDFSSTGVVRSVCVFDPNGAKCSGNPMGDGKRCWWRWTCPVVSTTGNYVGTFTCSEGKNGSVNFTVGSGTPTGTINWGACPYSNLQSRVQRDVTDPWKPQMSVVVGQSVDFLCAHDGSGQFAQSSIITINRSGTTEVFTGPTVTAWVPRQSGTYTITCKMANPNCGSLVSDTATLTVTGASMTVAPSPTRIPPSPTVTSTPTGTPVPTSTLVPTTTPTRTPTPTQTPTLTMTPTATVTPSRREVSFKMSYGGLLASAKCATNWTVKVGLLQGEKLTDLVSVVPEKVSDRIYRVTVGFADLTRTNGVAVFVKGPKHLQVKYGVDRQNGYYGKLAGELNLEPGKVFDFSDYPLLAGDINQDGVINGQDFSTVKAKALIHESVSEGADLPSDLDGNCQVNVNDVSILKLSLADKQSQLY